jgi:hypothetical protein
MERLVFQNLKAKKFFKPDDINYLIVLCDQLFLKNEQAIKDLNKALKKIDSLETRLEFYRNVTIRNSK